MKTKKTLLLALLLGFSSLFCSSPAWSGFWEATVNLQKGNAMMANSMYQGLTAFYYSDVHDYTSTSNLYYSWYFADQAKNYGWTAYLAAPAGSLAQTYAYNAWLFGKNTANYLYNVYINPDDNSSILNARNNARSAQLYLGYGLQACSGKY